MSGQNEQEKQEKKEVNEKLSQTIPKEEKKRKQNRTEQNKTKQNKTKQNKTKQNKTKQKKKRTMIEIDSILHWKTEKYIWCWWTAQSWWGILSQHSDLREFLLLVSLKEVRQSGITTTQCKKKKKKKNKRFIKWEREKEMFSAFVGENEGLKRKQRKQRENMPEDRLTTSCCWGRVSKVFFSYRFLRQGEITSSYFSLWIEAQKKKKKKKKWIFSWKELWDLIYCSFVSFFIPKNEPKSNQKKKTWESKYLAWQLETLKRWKGYWNHRWWWWRIKRKRFKPKKFIL